MICCLVVAEAVLTSKICCFHLSPNRVMLIITVFVLAVLIQFLTYSYAASMVYKGSKTIASSYSILKGQTKAVYDPSLIQYNLTAKVLHLKRTIKLSSLLKEVYDIEMTLLGKHHTYGDYLETLVQLFNYI